MAAAYGVTVPTAPPSPPPDEVPVGDMSIVLAATVPESSVREVDEVLRAVDNVEGAAGVAADPNLLAAEGDTPCAAAAAAAAAAACRLSSSTAFIPCRMSTWCILFIHPSLTSPDGASRFHCAFNEKRE